MRSVHRFFRNIVPGVILAAALCSTAMAADAPARAVMQAPGKNAAILAHMPGMVNNVKAKTLLGATRNINDGIVIRRSTIKDGKIIIPPSGLYLTVRSSNWFPFDAEPFTIAGKLFHAITFRSERDVVRNVEFKEGQIIPIDSAKSRGFQLMSFDTFSWGQTEGSCSAEFRFVKSTGNFYGENFPVQIGPKVTNAAADGSFVNGSKLPEGVTIATVENGLDRGIWGTNIATVGRTYIIVDKLEGDVIKVREMATDSTATVFVSPSDPVVASYAKGDRFTIGDATIEVTDVTGNAASITITDKTGSVTKTFGPLTPENTNALLVSMPQRELVWALSKDGTVAVHLNIRPKETPIANGKVSLVAFDKVSAIDNGSVWPSDPRFLARLETCATCSYPHEVMLENDKEIVLDGGANKVFVGPDKYFSIVIDDFDGKVVNAWHIESSKGDKSPNLSTRAGGKNIDLVVNKDCRSTVHFMSRYYNDMYEEQLKGMDSFK